MIVPVILAGGSGTRLWPASRKSYPKQFTTLAGDRTLFQETAVRLSGDCFAAPTVVTGSDFRFITAEQLSDVGIEDSTILIEPEGRNTAPAILAAALHHEATPDALLLVAPSDHTVADPAAFLAAVEAGSEAARKGQIVTFGVEPTRPETGYGYLEVSKDVEPGCIQPLKAFVEKPHASIAKLFFEGGRHLWNAGIFLFRVSAILEAFEVAAPRLVMPCRAAVATGTRDLCFFRLGGGSLQSLRRHLYRLRNHGTV